MSSTSHGRIVKQTNYGSGYPPLVSPFLYAFHHVYVVCCHIHRIRTLLLWLSQAADRSPETAWRCHSSYSRCTYKAPRLLPILEIVPGFERLAPVAIWMLTHSALRLVSQIADYLPLPPHCPQRIASKRGRTQFPPSLQPPLNCTPRLLSSLLFTGLWRPFAAPAPPAAG